MLGISCWGQICSSFRTRGKEREERTNVTTKLFSSRVLQWVLVHLLHLHCKVTLQETYLLVKIFCCPSLR